MLQKSGSVKAQKILTGGQDVDGRIGEELEEVLQVVEDDGSDDFEAQ